MKIKNISNHHLGYILLDGRYRYTTVPAWQCMNLNPDPATMDRMTTQEEPGKNKHTDCVFLCFSNIFEKEQHLIMEQHLITLRSHNFMQSKGTCVCARRGALSLDLQEYLSENSAENATVPANLREGGRSRKNQKVTCRYIKRHVMKCFFLE